MALQLRPTTGSGQETFRPDLPQSSRMNALVEALNVGPITESALDRIHDEMRTIYPSVVDESAQQYRARPQVDPSFVGPEQRVDADRWNVAIGGGIDAPRSVEKTYQPSSIGYKGPGNVQARVAGNVGLSQERFSPELMQRIAPDYAGLDPNQDKPYLSPDEEIYHLQEFARLKGVTTLEVEQSPALTEEFGRYLGQKTMTMDNDRYVNYTREGQSFGGRTPTLYRTPSQISNYNRQTYPDAAGNPEFAITDLARGNREQIVQNLVDYGMLREHAEERYDEAVKLNPEESVLAKNMHLIASATTSKKAKQEYAYHENGLFGIADKVHKSLMGTMRSGPMGPAAIERFAMKIEQGNPNFSRSQARDFLYSFVSSYAMVKESNPNAGRAYADFMVLAVLHHAKTKLSNYERKKSSDDADRQMRNESTEEAAIRGERSLMVGISDDRKIGKLILDAMGFEQARSEEHAIAGSMAKNMMVDAFESQDANPDSEMFGDWNEQLFQKEIITETNPDGSIKLDEKNQPRKHMNFTLTSKGLDIAERLTPMIEVVMPGAVKDVRYNRRPVVPSIESVTKSRSGGPRKMVGKTIKQTGKPVDIGDVTEMDEMKNVSENTGVGISIAMAALVQEILTEFQNILARNGNDINSIGFLNDYKNSMMFAIEHSKYQNMKGDGTGNRGIYGDRPGVVLKRDRQGNFLKTNKQSGIDEIVEQEFADELGDFSDRIKDGQFDSAIEFIQRNVVNGVSKEFFYDYFYGLNTRLNVDQNVGNYQHNKLIRSLIESHKKFAYQLNNPMHVISLKAGIMKRFGYDKMDVLTAADQFDKEVDLWEGTTTAEKINIGKNWEGWASVAAIAEAVQFNQAIKDPNVPVYTSGFFTEVDGLTNGMAHSAAQAGDMRTGWGAGLFDPIRYDHWVRNYDLIEQFQREGNLDALADLEHAQGNSTNFAVYLDAYNRVNESMKNDIRRLWDGSSKPGVPMSIGLPGLITDAAHEGAMAIMQLAHAGGDGKGQGSRKFVDAIRIMSKEDPVTGKIRNKLGRSFVKKPVMIFGYGAGAARIRESVRNFVDDLFLKDPSLREEFIANGIDIDKEFIDPLGVIAAEAVNQSFGIIKEFATTLSETATVAKQQGFPLNIPTLAGYKINLGGITYQADEGNRVRYKYNPGVSALERDRYLTSTDPEYVQKEKTPNAFEGISQMMVSDWNPFFEVNGFLKAATQITVMLNHANDNINMNRHLVNVHKRKLAQRGINYNSSNTDAGNTALHIFDGLLVMPIEAEMHTKELNKVFGDMAKANKGHTSFVIDALTYELHANGDRISDPKTDIGTRGDFVKIGAVEFDTSFKRLLSEEGEAVLATHETWGTWHPGLDKYAFQWKDDSATVLEKLNLFDTRRQKMANNITNYHQFFWATQDVNTLLNNNPDRVSAHVKPRNKI